MRILKFFQLNKLYLLLFLSHLVSAQSFIITDGDDSLKKIAIEFVSARNENNSDKRVNILNGIMGGSNFPKLSTGDFLGEMLKAGGQFIPSEFYNIGGGLAVHIVGQELKTGEWMRYQLGLIIKGKKIKIGLIAQTPARKPVTIPLGNIDSAKVQKFLINDMNSLSSDYGMSGALLIMKKNKIILENYSGNASDKTGERIDKNTMLNMASGSKMFTAVMIGIAVQKKLLNWNSTINEYIPSLSNEDWSRKIRIKDLLSHSSGLGEYWDSDFDRVARTIKTLDDIIPYFINKPLIFEPGSQAEYTNTNFIVLGLILENIYGIEYKDLVKKQILNPLNMGHTVYGKTEGQNVEYYMPAAPGEWESISLASKMGSSSAGGMFSTVSDLGKFASGLLEYKLVSKDILEKMTSYHSNLGAGKYGYGFEITTNDKTHFGHGGRGPGAHFMLKIYPKNETVLIFMVNRDSPQYLDYLLNLGTVLNKN